MTRADFDRALSELQPAFGCPDDQLNEVIPNGIIDYGGGLPALQQTCTTLLHQLQASARTNLLSVVFEGAPGSGKTALAAQMALQARAPHRAGAARGLALARSRTPPAHGHQSPRTHRGDVPPPHTHLLHKAPTARRLPRRCPRTPAAEAYPDFPVKPLFCLPLLPLHSRPFHFPGPARLARVPCDPFHSLDPAHPPSQSSFPFARFVSPASLLGVHETAKAAQITRVFDDALR